jgi:hypothetical protein
MQNKEARERNMDISVCNCFFQKLVQREDL